MSYILTASGTRAFCQLPLCLRLLTLPTPPLTLTLRTHLCMAGSLKILSQWQISKSWPWRQYGAPFVSEVRQSGPWRTSVTGRWDGLLKQTARIPHADCCKSPPGRAVGSGRGRPAVTSRRDGLLKQTARIPGADWCRSSSERAVDGRPWRAAGRDFWNKRHGFLAPIVAKVRQSGPWEQAVDGRPWRAAGTDFWNKRHGFLAPIVAEVRQSGPWTAGRDGPPGGTFETNGTDSWRRLLQKSVRAGRGSRPWTAGRDGPPGRAFETNGTDSWRRLLQKFVRAGRGRPAVTGRRNGLWKQTARIPGADCCRSSSERAVDDRPWRAAGGTFETNGTDSWRRLLQKSVRAGRGSRPWTDVRDGPLGCTFETNGTDSLRRLFQNSVRAGRGRPVVTGRWGVLLKQTAQIPGADCFRIPSERAVDGLSWRAAGMDFWNKWHGFLMPIVSIAGTLGCVFIDNETHESGVTKCTTGEAWSAFSWHHSSVFHCQWTHNQVFLLLSHMLI